MIKSERLLIRPIQSNDSDAVFAYRSDAVTNAYQSWIPESPEDVVTFIEKNPSAFNIPQTWFQLVLIEKETHKLIGDIGVHFKDAENKQCQLGCTVSKHWHANGYAVEAMSAVISYLFKHLGKHRITASVDPDNAPSIRMMECLGFRKEAHFKKSLFWKGRWVDDVIYAILGEEW